MTAFSWKALHAAAKCRLRLNARPLSLRGSARSTDENRYITVGSSNRGRVLMVAHVERGDRVTIDERADPLVEALDRGRARNATIRGSWWAHPKGNDIFLCSRAIRKSADVLVCRLVGGKVTYVHRRLWPALVRLAERFDADRLAAIREVHTASGRHKVDITPFPDWVPREVMRAAEELPAEDAASLLALVPTPHR